MEICICSDNTSVIDLFASVAKNKNNTLTQITASEYRKSIKKCAPKSIFYLDISSIDESAISKDVNFLLKQDSLYAGIIDPKGKIGDVASLFHKGLCDYLGKALSSTNITAKRLAAITEFKDTCDESDNQSANSTVSPYKIVNSDWSNVIAGQEYTFLFMHIYFDDFREVEKNYEHSYAVKMVNKTRAYLESAIAPSGGKVWMWMESSGLMLFPFNGRSVPEIELAYKLILNRKLINVENGFRIPFSYRLSMHIGNTNYEEEGETGNIVSDSINSIFHLGNKFTPPGNIYMTQEVANFIPERVQSLFQQVGEYEGRTITRIKLPFLK